MAPTKSKLLDLKCRVQDLIPKNKPNCIGIEVEVEGSFATMASTDNYWHVKEESSLRSGAEFVLRTPTHISDVPVACEELEKHIKRFVIPAPSIRTSTHIHVSVTDFTQQEVYNAIFAYYLFEEILVRSQPKVRVANLFCLRLSDARAIEKAILSSLKVNPQRENYLMHLRDKNRFKYGALNLATIMQYGTMEFRFLASMVDAKSLVMWTGILYNLVHKGKEYTPKKLLELYELLSPHEMCKEFLGDGADFLFMKQSSEYLNMMMHTNYDLIQEASLLMEKQWYRTPPAWWEEDYTDAQDYEELQEANPTFGQEQLAALAAMYEQAATTNSLWSMPNLDPEQTVQTVGIHPTQAFVDEFYEASPEPEADFSEDDIHFTDDED